MNHWLGWGEGWFEKSTQESGLATEGCGGTFGTERGHPGSDREVFSVSIRQPPPAAHTDLEPRSQAWHSRSAHPALGPLPLPGWEPWQPKGSRPRPCPGQLCAVSSKVSPAETLSNSFSEHHTAQELEQSNSTRDGSRFKALKIPLCGIK